MPYFTAYGEFIRNPDAYRKTGAPMFWEDSDDEEEDGFVDVDGVDDVQVFGQINRIEVFDEVEEFGNGNGFEDFEDFEDFEEEEEEIVFEKDKYYTLYGDVIKDPEAYAKTGAPMFKGNGSTNINEQTVIYKLELEHGKKYVGKTVDLERRMKQHWSGNGAKVTQKFKPKDVEVVDVVPGFFSNEVEHSHTEDLIEEHGYENVRGGYFCNSKTLKKPTENKSNGSFGNKSNGRFGNTSNGRFQRSSRTTSTTANNWKGNYKKSKSKSKTTSTTARNWKGNWQNRNNFEEEDDEDEWDDEDDFHNDYRNNNRYRNNKNKYTNNKGRYYRNY